MARAASLADHYRAHRVVFCLAQELGCTPREAEAELAVREAEAARRAAHERWAETERRLKAKADAAPTSRRTIETPAPAQPWMLRD